MKKLLALFVGTVLSTCLLASCAPKNPLPADKASFAGYWVAPDQSSVCIFSDGTAQIASVDSQGLVDLHKGYSAEFQENKLILRSGQNEKSFSITEAPKLTDDGTWVLKFDGTEYQKHYAPGEIPNDGSKDDPTSKFYKAPSSGMIR